MPAQKKFKLGNLKNYAIVAVAAFSVMGTPSKLQAQNNVKPEIEHFNLKKASERDKALYNAITNVLEIKYSEEEAATKAGQIMSQTSEFHIISGLVRSRHIGFVKDTRDLLG